jgi:hypothetical protein
VGIIVGSSEKSWHDNILDAAVKADCIGTNIRGRFHAVQALSKNDKTLQQHVQQSIPPLCHGAIPQVPSRNAVAMSSDEAKVDDES